MDPLEYWNGVKAADAGLFPWEPVKDRELLAALAPLEKLILRPAQRGLVLEYEEKVLGGIYGDRLLVKITESSLRLLAPTAYCMPHAGSREMLLVESRDPAFLTQLFEALAKELPAVRK